MPGKSLPPKAKLILAGALIILIGLGAFLLFGGETQNEPTVSAQPGERIEQRVIGQSVEGRNIQAFTFLPVGATTSVASSKHLLFVGGIHGGYEWNSVLLAYEFIDYLTDNPAFVPDDVTVSVIPSLNPDGVYEVIGKEGRFSMADVPEGVDASSGRFNANDVDLNRNFDCKWAPESTWRGETVSAGTGAFSEPEARALRDFVQETQPEAVVFWHSQADAVYASECEAGVLPDTLAAMEAYAGAAGYRSIEQFDAYEITGDAEGWLASLGIPAITVELSSHETIEWNENLAGAEALIDLYSLAK